jgi:hypothetical protein
MNGREYLTVEAMQTRIDELEAELKAKQENEKTQVMVAYKKGFAAAIESLQAAYEVIQKAVIDAALEQK